jgi:hypothetical protein
MSTRTFCSIGARETRAIRTELKRMSSPPAGSPATQSTLVPSIVITLAGFLVGVATHFTTLYFRDNGPTFGSVAFNGNGAIIFLLLAPIGLIVGEAVAFRSRAWAGAVVLPFAIIGGMFAFGGI